MSLLARRVAAVLAAAVFGPATIAAHAQISPGPLSVAHAKLEGASRCLTCHKTGEGVDPGLCLDCHRALGARISTDKGLHTGPEFQRCERCHPEHNGVAFVLVDWGTGGRDRFDHARTGWRLEGKHVTLACRECHRPDRLDRAVLSTEPEIDPERTYLGLKTACVACHRDPHGGSVGVAAAGTHAAATGSCTDCHSQTSWKAVSGFDHSRTRFPLEGAHSRVDCARCHLQPQRPPGAPDEFVFTQFRSRALPACAECHRDPHAGRLGADCASCHDLVSFRSRALAQAGARGFDHDRTAYPLRGRHRPLACERCHQPGRDLRIAGFQRCETCHRDPHAGQLASVPGHGACADCHDVTGFSPAQYGPTDHASSSFPLAGAHLAVPCSACHRMVPAASLPAAFRRSASSPTLQFRFDREACRDCHRDPHAGKLERFEGKDGCRSCHSVDGWRQVRFDHARTRFALTGKHSGVACAKCHPADASGVVALSGRPLDCAGCHRDPHAGQFAVAGTTDCARCHGLDGFRPAPGFVHARDSRFQIDGAHARVACAGCHPTEQIAGTPVVRYKPRPMTCEGCHGPNARPPARSAGRNRS
jgi:hypothetical protein